MPHLFTRPVPVIDKRKTNAFRDASQITNVRAIHAASNFISNGGVLTSAKKAMQAAKGGNYVLSSTLNNALTSSRVKIISPLPNSGSTDLFVAQYTSTGSLNWIARIGGTGVEQEYCISTDSAGNINMTGAFDSPTVTFYDKNGNAAAILARTSFTNDGFIAQYSSAGNVNWVAQITGTSSDVPRGITTDSTGNIIVGGLYASPTLTFYNKNNGTAFASTLANSGGNDGFIAQYSSTGDVNWVAQIAGSSGETLQDISTDSAGNINIIGTYSSTTLTFYNKNNGTAFASTLPNTGTTDTYIAQYSSAGNVNWVARIAGSLVDFAPGISTDSTGKINVTGYYTSSTLTFYNKNNGTAFATTLANSGSNDVFIAQYSSAGNVNWVARIAGTSQDYANEITTDSAGNIIVVGSYTSDPLTFYNKNNGTAFASTLANSGGNDGFIAQYSSTGDVNWVARIAGTSSDFGYGVSTDSAGNINVTGNYQSTTLTFYNKNNGTAFATTLPNSGSSDVFTAQYSSTGDVNWVTRIAGTGGEVGYGISTDSTGKIAVCGNYSQTNMVTPQQKLLYPPM